MTYQKYLTELIYDLSIMEERERAYKELAPRLRRYSDNDLEDMRVNLTAILTAVDRIITKRKQTTRTCGETTGAATGSAAMTPSTDVLEK